jgi:GNAT superfamily N-acetyltransferase
MRIRPAQPVDSAAVARLLGHLGYPADAGEVTPRLAALREPDDAVLLAVSEVGAELGLVGLHRFAVLSAPAPVAYITALVTAPEARGRGVGRALVAAAEAWARERGCGRLTVTSAEHRADAHEFYPACGLPYTGRRFSKALDPCS